MESELPNVFSREPNGIVQLRMTQDEWEQLILALGVHAGARIVMESELPNVFSREPNGIVQLRMTQDEWEQLILALGVHAGARMASDRELFLQSLRVVNRINCGNPDFIPYEIPTEAQP